MIADVPLVSYKKKEKELRTKKDMEDFRKAWEEKRKNRSFAGKKVKLNDFLNNKVDNE